MTENISFSDFQKMDIRIGKIESAERVEGTDRLLNLKVSFGTEKRQIVAGLAQMYSPEQLVGRKTIFLFNLEAKRMRGLESRGMILVAGSEGRYTLLVPDRDVPEGARLE